MSLSLSSQTVTCSSDKKDTTICFSIPQSRVILKQLTKRAELDTLLKVCELKSALLQKQIDQHKSTISYFTRINDNQSSILTAKDKQITILNSEIATGKKEIKKQKTQKFAFAGLSGLLLVFLVLK